MPPRATGASTIPRCRSSSPRDRARPTPPPPAACARSPSAASTAGAPRTTRAARLRCPTSTPSRGTAAAVVLAFDSDAMTKPEVHEALRRLRALLAKRKAEVTVAYLPALDSGAKVGLDDGSPPIPTGTSPSWRPSAATPSTTSRPSRPTTTSPTWRTSRAGWCSTTSRWCSSASSTSRPSTTRWRSAVVRAHACARLLRHLTAPADPVGGEALRQEPPRRPGARPLTSAAPHHQHFGGGHVPVGGGALAHLRVRRVGQLHGTRRRRGQQGAGGAGQRRATSAAAPSPAWWAKAWRMEPAEFEVFSAVCLAGIGDVVDTIEDRSITVPLERLAPGEKVESFRRRQVRAVTPTLARRLAAWAARHGEEIAATPPVMAAGVRGPRRRLLGTAARDRGCRRRPVARPRPRRPAPPSSAPPSSTRRTPPCRCASCATSPSCGPTDAPSVFSATLVEALDELEDAPWSELGTGAASAGPHGAVPERVRAAAADRPHRRRRREGLPLARLRAGVAALRDRPRAPPECCRRTRYTPPKTSVATGTTAAQKPYRASKLRMERMRRLLRRGVPGRLTTRRTATSARSTTSSARSSGASDAVLLRGARHRRRLLEAVTRAVRGARARTRRGASTPRAAGPLRPTSATDHNDQHGRLHRTRGDDYCAGRLTAPTSSSGWARPCWGRAPGSTSTPACSASPGRYRPTRLARGRLPGPPRLRLARPPAPSPLRLRRVPLPDVAGRRRGKEVRCPASGASPFERIDIPMTTDTRRPR